VVLPQSAFDSAETASTAAAAGFRGLLAGAQKQQVGLGKLGQEAEAVA